MISQGAPLGFPILPLVTLLGCDVANDKDDDLEIPVIPHERLWAPGKAGSVLKGRVVEVRGLRSMRKDIYHDAGWNAVEDASPDHNNPGMVFDWLNQSADRVLKAAGEKTRDEVVATVQDAPPFGTPEANEVYKLAFGQNLVEVTGRHGALSREATAARWLLMSDDITYSLRLFDDANSDLLERLMHWADAWYWLRFEESAAHYLAFSGLKSHQGRKAGPEARAKAKQARERIIREEFANLHPGSQRTLDAALFDITTPLAARFAKAGYEPYTQGTLRKELTRLKLVKEARAAHSNK